MTVQEFEALTLEQFHQRYEDVLSTTLHVEPDPLPTFLDISGFPHYEEVISNWYAFFFNTTAAHGFGSLFIDTLVQMINESNMAQEMPAFVHCRVIRERTVKDKRIDLLLYDESYESGGEECYRNAIIIENKIFAALYNELAVYYTNITAEVNKSGVVLSISRHTELPPNFINITHTEFLNRVLKNMGGYLFRASDKYLLLFKDLVQQISLFNKTENMKEYVSFYFEHAEKINELSKIRTKAMEALITDLQVLLETTPFSTGRKYPDSVNLRCSYHNNILLILKTEKIFDHASYAIELWLSYDLAKAGTDDPMMISRIKTIAVIPPDFVFNVKKSGAKYTWLGTQTKVINRTLSDIQQLPSNIAEDFNINWGPFILKILETLGHKAFLSEV
jgi:hypothetical protein